MGENIFTSQTPTGTDQSDGVSYALGTLFTAAVNGTINGIRWYTPVTNDGGYVAGLYSYTSEAAGTELARVNFTVVTPGTWNYTAFAAPVSITAGTKYVAVIYTPNHYTFKASVIASAVINGNLTAPAAVPTTQRNGKFVVGPGALAYPTNGSDTGTAYFVDVDFTAAGGPTTVQGTLTAALGTVTGTLTGRRTVHGVLSAALGAITAALAGYNPSAASRTTGSWYQLASIFREAREYAAQEAQSPPSACPNDGEPLRSGPHGVLYCPYDGWQWSG